jgi:hypothetical protein
MTTITNIEAGRIVDWLHEDDTLISTDSRRFILRDGWTVAVDLSTVALFHYSQPVNPGGYAPEIYEAVSMAQGEPRSCRSKDHERHHHHQGPQDQAAAPAEEDA